MIDFARVALRGRCLGSFRAPNPWEGGAVDCWNVYVYQAVARSFVASAAARLDRGASAPQQLMPGQWPQRLRFHQAIGIESSDARHHLLPGELEPLCRSGALPLERLPQVLHGCERGFVRSDFRLHLPKVLLRWLAPLYGLMAIVLLVLATREGDPPTRHLYLGLAALLLAPLAAWAVLTLHWRARAMRWRRRFATFVQEPTP